MKKFLVLALAVGLLAACANQPIYDVSNHPVPIAAQKLPLDRIEALIIQAGQSRNWKFQRADVGHLIATQTDPKFSATVDVYFDRNNYRIIHKATTGLKEKNGTIHPHYNSWIRYLERDIDTYLTNASVTTG
jgi:hypothetical protein